MGPNSKRIMAVVLVAGALAVLWHGVALALPPWSDAPNSYWVDGYGVTDTKIGGVAEGYQDGTFRPTLAVNRGQFAKMAVDGLDLATVDPSQPTFVDVAKGSTFFTYIEGAYEEGLVTGYPVAGDSALEYRPASNISRQQANSILGRYLAEAELSVTGVIRGPSGTTYGSLLTWYRVWGEFQLGGFLDWEQIAPVHRPFSAYLVYHGVTKGSDARLFPSATLTRSQAAVMILRVADEAAQITTAPPPPKDLSVVPISPDRDATPEVKGQTIPGGIVHVFDAVDGAPAVDLFAGVSDDLAPRADATGAFTAHLPALTDGSHVFTARVKNAAGLYSPLSISSANYVLDTVAPTGSITTPSVPNDAVDAAVNTNEPTFTVVAADDRTGVGSVAFVVALKTAEPQWQTVYIDAAPEGGNLFQARWPSGLADGQYLFEAIVYDHADNALLLGPLEVTVDTAAPTALIAAGSLEPVAVDGIFYTAARKPSFVAAAFDVSAGEAGTHASGVAAVDFMYAPLAPAPDGWEDFSIISSDSAASGFAQYDPSLPLGLSDGRYLFAVRATDRAGNGSALLSAPPAYVPGVTRQVVIDNVDPTGTVTYPAAGLVSSPTPGFAVTASDVTAGVRTVEFQYALSSEPPVWSSISVDDEAPYEAAWGAYSMADGGGYLLRAVVTDKSGRVSVTDGVAVLVDLP